MDKVKLAVQGAEPRPFCGKTSYHDLTDAEREKFAQKRRDAVSDSDMTPTAKQAVALRSGFAGGLSLAAAFERYVNQEDRWYR